MYRPEEIHNYYRRHGLAGTVERVAYEFYSLLLALLLTILDQIRENDGNSICIAPRASTLDQDTLSLILQNHVESRDYTIYVALDSIKEQKTMNQEFLKQIDGYSFELVEKNSLRFIWTFSSCQIILLKGTRTLWHYRLLSSSSKHYIRIPHGIPAKDPKYPPSPQCSLYKLTLGKLQRNELKWTVASDNELHREVAISNKKPEKLRRYGYPRFDRLRHLSENPDMSILPKSKKKLFENPEDSIDILYAPTHKDDVYETTLFPFPDFNQEELTSFLESNGIRIFIRMHVSEEDVGIAKEFVDGDRYQYAGNEFFGSAVEMMPYFDAMITDFSSIYLDYVLFDRPILFVQDDIEQFRELRGFAFDYDRYWPGPKIETQQEFISHLERICEGETGEYAYERQFVRDTFHPTTESSFLSSLQNE